MEFGNYLHLCWCYNVLCDKNKQLVHNEVNQNAFAVLDLIQQTPTETHTGREGLSCQYIKITGGQEKDECEIERNNRAD